jgi:hypothetical protein
MIGHTPPPKFLVSSEVVSLWIHFEERANEIKGQMYTTLTFLDTAIITLSGFYIAYFIEHGNFFEAISSRKLIHIILSSIGLILSFISIILANEYIDHIRRNFKRANKLRSEHTDLHYTLNFIGFTLCEGRERQGFLRNLGDPQVFFRTFSIFSAIIFFLLLLVILVYQR